MQLPLRWAGRMLRAEKPMAADDRQITIFLSAAEASGDSHGAHLVRSLRDRLPNARILGVAGPKMAAAGCEVIADMTTRASMLGGPLTQLGYYVPLVLGLQRKIRQLAPDVVVPIDSPALNWHLAKAARKAGSSVVYYISPQVWAWAPWRVKKLARLTDQVACILPFERRYLQDRGVEAKFVGHPLLDSLPDPPDPMPDILSAWSDGSWKVALLPGSRSSEIKGHAKALAACGRTIRRRWPKSRCIFSVHDQRAADALSGVAKENGIEILVDQTHKVLSESHFAIAASGTVTLEVAHFGVPMVIFYRTSLMMGLLHRLLGHSRKVVATPHLSLVNILAGRRIVPELMPWHGNIKKLREMVMDVMMDLGYLLETRQRLVDLTASLGGPNGATASENAADLIVKAIEKHRQ